MAIASGIKVNGISVDDESGQLTYIVTGTTDYNEAIDEIASVSPSTINGLVRDKIRADAEDRDDHWTVTATYRQINFSAQPVNSFSISFAAGTTQTHIERAIAQRRYGAGAPDVGNLIGVTKDGVEGVDISTPVLTKSYRHVFPASHVTTTYINNLGKLVGSVNASPFKGDARGELLLTSATGSTREDGDWEITFDYAYSENQTNIAVGNGITVDYKYGWEYLWLMYETVEDATAHALIKQPVGAYVAEVYRFGNWIHLGVGS